MTGMRELVIDCRDEAERSEIHGTLEAAELLRQAATAIDTLSAQVEELRGALKPFAEDAFISGTQEWSAVVAARRALASEQTGG